MTEKGMLTADDLAELLNVPVGTVYVMNCRGTAPPYFKVGRRVRYSRADVDAWLEAQRAQPKAS